MGALENLEPDEPDEGVDISVSEEEQKSEEDHESATKIEGDEKKQSAEGEAKEEPNDDEKAKLLVEFKPEGDSSNSKDDQA